MKKRKNKISKVLAKLVLSTAKTGAGLASAGGWHQPKVPKKLVK